MNAAVVDSAADVARDAQAALAAGEALRMLGAQRRCELLAAAARELASPEHPHGAALRAALFRGTGLSQPMVEWCLTTTLASVREQALSDLMHEQCAADLRPRALAAVVLAGNVFTAGVRGLLLPLLAGVPVLAKVTSGADALPHALQRALSTHDGCMSQALRVVRFGREAHAQTDAMLAHAEVVSVYGDDSTVSALTERGPRGATVLAHGHGLSALYVSRAALTDEHAALQAAQRAALDVAAYDQRGCLSPHFVLVQSGAAVSAQAFAELLAQRALPTLQTLLPLGEVDLEQRAACLQWRAAASARGELYASESHAVSYEERAALRPSPGARHVGVYACDDLAQLVAQLARFGEHLKSVGVAGPASVRAELMRSLRGTRPARVCRAGEMQTPPMAADADGLPALEGFFRRR